MITAAYRVLLLSLVIFVLAFATHEVMHLLVVYAVGGTGTIVLRPWRLAFFDASIFALHVQPDQPIGTAPQAIVNFLGPTLAAIPLVIVLAYVRERVVRIALIANIAILGFFAIIETVDFLAESVFDVDYPVLTTPEFNYGVPLLIFITAAYAVALGWWSNGRRADRNRV
jgi:hypothetical protein